MRIEICTLPMPFVAGRDSSDKRFVDLSKRGNQKWLVSHLKWAASNNYAVTITPASY